MPKKYKPGRSRSHQSTDVIPWNVYKRAGLQARSELRFCSGGQSQKSQTTLYNNFGNSKKICQCLTIIEKKKWFLLVRRWQKLGILQNFQRFRRKFKGFLCERRRRERNFTIFCSRAAFLCIWEQKTAQIVDLFAGLGGCWSTLSTPPRYGPE